MRRWVKFPAQPSICDWCKGPLRRISTLYLRCERCGAGVKG